MKNFVVEKIGNQNYPFGDYQMDGQYEYSIIGDDFSAKIRAESEEQAAFLLQHMFKVPAFSTIISIDVNRPLFM